MTRLPSDSSLPPGTMDPSTHLELSLAGLVGSHASSVISPLSLPGGVQYFDPVSRPLVTSHPNNPTATTSHALSRFNSADSRDPPRAQPAGFLSPHLTPIPSHSQHRLQFQRQPQQRAASLSPTRGPAGSRTREARMMDGKRQPDFDVPSAILPPGVQVPVDTISGTGSGLITVRRPALRTNPSHESATTDSHVSTTEHEYRKIEKLRQAFDDERRHLQASRDRAEEVYREIIEELEREHARQRGAWEADKYELQTQVMQLQSRLRELEAHVNPNKDSNCGPFQHRSPTRLGPTLSAGLNALVCQDVPTADSSAASDAGEPSKVIDVQEYHQDLEGIHLKENAVKKETFTDTPSSTGSKASSGKASPSEDVKALARARSIQVLKAPAHSRLTMHAGHTPTVSLSMSHTQTSNTVASSGSNTPTLTNGDGVMSADEANAESSEPAEPVPTGADGAHEPAILEPSDEDPELKGPLTLRNVPAKDEIFLRKVSDKLERVLSGEDATPTVLQHAKEESNSQSNTKAPSDEDQDADGVEDIEPDVPLKLRNAPSNFGKPFGVI